MVRTMVRTICLICLASFATSLAASPVIARSSDRPNVIVILTDDQGWGDLSLNGNTNLATPNIDGLAAAGLQFDRFFVCPVCSPTRAEFLTGRYHSRSGVFSTSAGGERIDLDEMTIAETFRKAGYATGAFGKWHNGMQYPYHPNGRGFDEYYGFCSGHWGDYFSPPLEHNGKLVRGSGFVIDDFTNRAIEFMEKHRDQPFFAYLPFNTPHSPMQAPERFWKKFKDANLEMRHRDPKREKIEHTRAALAMCENIDWNVGRILKKLDEWQIAENTIVVYFCDNGPNGSRWNGDMKGRKGSTDEGGVRSPLLIRWPNHAPAGKKIEPIGAAIDLLPSLAALCNIQVASKKPLDGIDLSPVILGKRDTMPDRTIFSHWRGRVSARTQTYRLDNAGKLFNLARDPGQRNDVSKKHPKITAKLRSQVDAWKSNVMAEDTRANRTFPIGHRDYRYTQIPARDGVPTGEVKRSNRFPNCSYFLNWVNPDDTIEWNADVAESGRYQVDIFYACPADDVGSEVELSINGAALRSKITQAHDAPVRGGEHDLLKRQESYVKDFRRMTMGTVELKKGKGPLLLKALNMPGKQVMEFRLLQFIRLD